MFLTSSSYPLVWNLTATLQRQERSAQEGDSGSPARLTIAQAALLNLRGQQLRPSNSSSPINGQTERVPSGSARAGGFTTSVSAPDFSSNAHLNLPPVIGSSGGGLQGIGIGGGGAPGLEVDYSLAPGKNVVGSRSRSPYELQSHGQYSFGHTPPPPLPTSLPSSSSATNPSMSALLDSLRSTGVPFQPSSAGGFGVTSSAAVGEYDYNSMPGQGHHHQQYHQDQHLQQHQHHLPTMQSLDSFSHQYGHSQPRPAPAYTRSGYTPTEEYIMRAHAENAAIAHVQAQQQQLAERRRPAPLD
ncbi:hypothetical protein CPB84DRAFT_162147 [Gymnopilus junonius]|uniref:Uncharacterized protein n=1 Tax=Gymnopilus junonius TaxID=109634 RepID=A0A9P5TRD5_GYMJU|nr:hypothetical protein CPB84DRAFT_162147 [Gymnopilus junonius]